MTKQETQLMKGVAILLMIFLHLFDRMQNVELCSSYLYIGDSPFVYWLSAATSPVSFFLILSGYGMHFIYSRKNEDSNRWNRIRKIYTHWWVILIIFTIPMYFINGAYYDSVKSVIYNYSAFNTSWYGEGWFLFPFLCLSLLSFYIFKITDRFKARWILVVAFLIGTCTGYIVSRYGEQYLYRNLWLYNPFLIVHLAPSFLFGAMMQRTDIISKYQKRHGGPLNYLLLVVIVIVMCMTRTSAWGPLYASSFIILFLAAPRWGWLDKTLVCLGNHSMNMWLIHAWFCYYIFHDLTYSLRYPLLIFVALTIVSLLCSYFVNTICAISSFIIERCRLRK